MSKIDATVLKDGQLAIATFEQSGTLISGASPIDTTCLVQTEDGVQQCVKTFPLGEGGGGGCGADTSLSNLTAAGKEVAGTMSMPSNSFVDITPTSGQLYTAVADGYIFVAANSAIAPQIIVYTADTVSIDTGTVILSSYCNISDYSQTVRAYCPIQKGQKFVIHFTSIAYAHFVYAKGSEPQQ